MRAFDRLVSSAEIRNVFLLYGKLDDIYPCMESREHPCGEKGLINLDQCLTELFGNDHIVIFFDVRYGTFENRTSARQEEMFQNLLARIGLPRNLRMKNEGTPDLRRAQLDRYFKDIMRNPYHEVVLVIRPSIRNVSENECDFDSLNRTFTEAGMGNLVIFEMAEKKNLPEILMDSIPEEQRIEIGRPDEEVRRKIVSDPTFCYYWKIHAADFEPEFLVRNREKVVVSLAGMSSREILRIGVRLTEHEIPVNEAPAYIDSLRSGSAENPWRSLDLERIRETLEHRVRGKEAMINDIVEALRRIATNGAPGSGPRLILFLAGATGTGKTETAKALAEGIFGSSGALTRFDFQNAKDGSSINTFLGSPTGYVGSDEETKIERAIRQNRWQVILFDEFTKASTEMDNIFLSIVDEGEVQLNSGKTVSLRDSVLIFTSNIGMKKVDEQYGINATQEEIAAEVEKAMRHRFSPEMWGRWKSKVKTYIFPYLSEEDILSIAEKFMEDIRKRYLDEENLRLLPEAAEIIDHEKEHFIAVDRREGGRAVRGIFEFQIWPWIQDALGKLKTERDSPFGRKATVVIDGFDWERQVCQLHIEDGGR